MFTSERHNQIVQRLQTDGKIKVKELSVLFEVSEDCIRKDLKHLEMQGQCKRVYGGAIVNSEGLIRNVNERKDYYRDAKKEIAKKAYELIQDNETIFLDISTTNIYLAQLLRTGKKRCIIVSNMIEILQILAANPLLSVIGTGGNVNIELNGFIGASTLSIVERHHFDRCFIGTLGLDERFEYFTTFDLDDGLIKSEVMKNSKTKYIVMDSHKFHESGNYKFVQKQKIDFVIMETSINEATKKNQQKSKIKFL